MDILKKELGKVLLAEEIAEYFDLDIKTVRKYYKEFGGMRIGRCYRFFERKVCDAIQENKPEDWQDCLCGPDKERGEEKGETVQDQEGGSGMGSQNAKAVRIRLAAEDKHNLFG